MPSSKVCWDACVFTSLLDGGVGRSPDEVSGLREVVDLVDRSGLIVITSTMIETEVIGEIEDPGVVARLEALFQRPNIVQVAASAEIMRKAGQIRTAARDAGRGIKAADAIYVATALLHHADALHSFDGKVLRLDGHVAVDGLPILKPRADQTILSL